MSIKYIILPFKNTNGKYLNAFNVFLNPFISYLNNTIKDYKILLVEQNGGKISDCGKELFNLGRTINIGFDILLKKNIMKEEDLFMFHPIDLIPIQVEYNVKDTTMFFPDEGHLNNNYYKAICFRINDFKKINGFSNKYWGWGWDDIDVKLRLEIKEVPFYKKIGSYDKLCDDGNGTDTIPHYSPLLQNNENYFNELKFTKNVMSSGLNTLTYKILDNKIDIIERYLVE